MSTSLRRTLDYMFCRMYDSQEKLLTARWHAVVELAVLAVLAIETLIWHPVHTSTILAVLASLALWPPLNLALTYGDARWCTQRYDTALAMNR
jgi:hypothetical protein